jgi:hypothetical protein
MPRAVLVAALGVLMVALDAAVTIAFPAISVAFEVPNVYAARLSVHAGQGSGPPGASAAALTDAFVVATAMAVAVALLSLVPPPARDVARPVAQARTP